MDATIIRDKLIGNDDERAVSPVIGVILMVAITVILAAVIAAFVMDLGDMSESANAGIDFDESGEHVTVQIIDEGNTDSIYVELENDEGTDYLNHGEPEVDEDEEPWEVGDSVELNSTDLAENDDFEDNSYIDGDNIDGDDEPVDQIVVYGEVGGDRQVVATWE